MIKKFLIFIQILFLTSVAYATEPKIDIRYDGIYLDHITLPQLEMLYKDYHYKDYIYMKDWQYPPIFLQSMPVDFEKITDPQKRNKLFLQIMVPLTLKLNQEIEAERLEIESIISDYNQKENHSFEEIVEFHVKFERIHPFQDGNGRVGRLIILKECLKNNIVPFVILDSKKMFYYRGLKNWDQQRGWLLDACLDGQDTVKAYLDYFGIVYRN